MNGLVGLVPLAELFAEMTGSRRGATNLALRILQSGAAGLLAPHDDIQVAARYELVAAGVVTDAGVPVHSRAAELITVCELLAASTVPSPTPPPGPRLVLSAPPGTVPILDDERLDGLVLDVLRQATTRLDIGGAFWNESGFEMLDEVLLPALRTRHIVTTIYVNSPVAERRASLVDRLEYLRTTGPITIRWFRGPRPTMLHAKFVIRDRRHGYLGTANLTSWGMQGHIEAGVELTVGQSERFVQFLAQLDAANLFGDAPGAIS